MSRSVQPDREALGRTLGDRWAAAWNSHEFEELAAIYSPECRCFDIADGSSFEGHTGLHDVWEKTLSYPDARNESLGSFSNGDDWAMEWRYTAVMRGQPRQIHGASTGTMDDQGRILTRRDFWDLKQLEADAG